MAWRSLAEEAVVLDLETSRYLSLNQSGALLWAMVSERPVSLDELVERLMSEFDVDRETAKVDVAEFLGACRQHGLLREPA